MWVLPFWGRCGIASLAPDKLKMIKLFSGRILNLKNCFMKHYFTHPLTIAASCLLILFSSCAEGTSEEKEETLTNQVTVKVLDDEAGFSGL